MPRTARIVVLGVPHHITQRGNNKTTTFFDDEDYIRYLTLLEKHKTKYYLDISSYALMPNHIHVKAIPKQADSFSKTFNYTQMCYTQYFNKKYKKVGHLWQSRFFSCPLDEQHSYIVTQYIELNPIRAQLVKNLEDWKWSSARDHLNIEQGIISLSPSKKVLDPQNWREDLKLEPSKELIETINKHTLLGKPLGNKTFFKMLENKLGRPLTSRPRGRPMIK
ncbi:MAG: transposase [Candidatus Omnitrophota bacterium]|nr:transposase [Candidatus Omnitrophota bacterium]